LRRRLRVVLGKADALEQPAVLFARIVDAQAVQRQLHHGGLIVGVINLEIARQAKAFRFPAQQPRRKGVEGPDPRIVVRLALADQQVAHALLHLRRGLVGERHGQNRMAVHALLDQVGDAVGNGARFSRARSGENQDWAIKGGCSFTLAGIQFVEERHVLQAGPFGDDILTDATWFGKFARA
jgi:hypothetical protein